MKEKFSVNKAITTTILKSMEASDGRVTLPWHHQGQGRPINVMSRKPYQGVNVPPLWIAAMQNGHCSNEWGTFNQWKSLGGHIRRGEKATLIVFYKAFQVLDEDTEKDEEDSEPAIQTRLFARAYWVFNRDQVDGLPEADDPDALAVNRIAPLAEAEHFIRATRANIRIGGGRAFYDRSADRIQMPAQHLFTGTRTSNPTFGWYSTLLHELTHWSGAPHRLNRVKGRRFGDRQYAFEELVAELGAAYLCADLGIANSPREDHAHYLKNWVSLLKDDDRAFFRAAAQAQAATNYLHQLQEDEKSKTGQAVA